VSPSSASTEGARPHRSADEDRLAFFDRRPGFGAPGSRSSSRKRRAHIDPASREERICHASADAKSIDHLAQISSMPILSLIFAPPAAQTKGPRGWSVRRESAETTSACHEKSRRHLEADARFFSRCMRAMRRLQRRRLRKLGLVLQGCWAERGIVAFSPAWKRTFSSKSTSRRVAGHRVSAASPTRRRQRRRECPRASEALAHRPQREL